MQTVVLGPRSAEIDAIVERRRRLGIDRFDEVWEGSYHMAPAAHPSDGYIDRQLAVLIDSHAKRAGLLGTGPFNIGTPENYRVPDGGFHRSLPTDTWVATAAVIVEVVSPDDETYKKFGFYFAHGVDELLIADPLQRSITIWTHGPTEFVQATSSALLVLESGALSALITWP